jgi:hypothetical protein
MRWPTSPSAAAPTTRPLDEGWGEPGLSPAERLVAWNTIEVLALGRGLRRAAGQRHSLGGRGALPVALRGRHAVARPAADRARAPRCARLRRGRAAAFRTQMEGEISRYRAGIAASSGKLDSCSLPAWRHAGPLARPDADSMTPLLSRTPGAFNALRVLLRLATGGAAVRCRGAGCPCASALVRAAGRLAAAAHSRGGAVLRRGRQRHRGARAGGWPGGAAGPSRCTSRTGPARPRPGHAGGRQGRARRLHAAAVGLHKLQRQPRAAQEAALRSGARPGAHCHRGAHLAGAGGGPGHALGFAAGDDRGRQGPARGASATAPSAPARARTWRAKCLRWPRASGCRPFRTPAPGSSRWRWTVGRSSWASKWPARWNRRCARAGCARWPCWASSAPARCPTYPRWPSRGFARPPSRPGSAWRRRHARPRT